MKQKATTLMGIAQTGTPHEIHTAVERLTRLPEFGMLAHLERVQSEARIVERLEMELREAKAVLREDAENLLHNIIRHWTCDEIRESTGYDFQ